MSKLKFLLISVTVLIHTDLFSQYTETITTSRPGQAFTPLTPGKNMFQVQTGFNTQGIRLDDSDTELDIVNYTALFRFGVHERIELRSIAGISRIDRDPGIQPNQSGFSAFSVGTKVNIINGADMNPKVALQADFFLPVVNDDFKSDKVATNLILAHTQGLTEKISLSTNLGAGWDGNGSDPIGLYVVNIGFSLPANIGAFIEAYGPFNSNDVDILYDTGLSYLVNNDLLFDLSAGYGKNGGIKQFFFDLGFSWRTSFEKI